MNKILMISLVLAFLSACTVKQEEVKSLKVEDEPIELSLNSATVFTTAKDTDMRLQKSGTMTFDPGEQPLETELSIFVNPDKTFQTFVGIGGAITDASAEVFAKLPEDKQEELLNAYYTEEGIGYSLLRTTIHSCDFSSGSYTYVEEGDKDLATFNIDHDKEFRIPMIKRALKAAGGSLLTYAAPRHS